jgi:hypothetical protein
MLFRLDFPLTSDAVYCYSQGWAAGDVSLAAYIQAAVKDKDYGRFFPYTMLKERL